MAAKKLKPQGIKILKMFHIFFAFSWIIGGVALCLLVFTVHPESGDAFKNIADNRRLLHYLWCLWISYYGIDIQHLD